MLPIGLAGLACRTRAGQIAGSPRPSTVWAENRMPVQVTASTEYAAPMGYFLVGLLTLALGLVMLVNPAGVRQRCARAPEMALRRLTGDERDARWRYRLMDGSYYWLYVAGLGAAWVVWGLMHP
jgi:hypothetical protein